MKKNQETLKAPVKGKGSQLHCIHYLGHMGFFTNLEVQHKSSQITFPSKWELNGNKRVKEELVAPFYP